MAEVLIALGSNVGDSLENLREACRRLQSRFGLLKASCIYETAPMYVIDQPRFLNAAVAVESSIGPRGILFYLKELETEIGRMPRQTCGPREIDLDLIAYGATTYRYFEGDKLILQVPHVRVAERRFVLQPLSDIVPDLLLPNIGVVSHLLEQTESQIESVTRVDHALLPI